MTTTTARTCHYEVLGVEMDADVDAIRKSYKRAALLWHPDKNMDQVDVATEKFRLVSEAYQVLSDPKERQWYDTHRESILRGGDGTAQQGMDDTYFVPDLFKYFTFPRTPEEFYKQFNQAFFEIVEAERSDLDRQNLPLGCEYPEFGYSQTSFDDVKKFYQAWEYFNSKMSFSWKDKYDTRSTENRFQRRHVEKMNDQERVSHRKEYTMLVRSLVAYCMKRDERYLAGMRDLEQKRLEKQEKQLAWERSKKEAKQRQKDEVAKMRLEEALAEAALAGEEDGEGEEEEIVVMRSVWNCGVCNKEFKSEKQLDNHEGSKKHKDAVKAFLKKGGSMPVRKSQEDVEENVDQLDELLVEQVVLIHLEEEEVVEEGEEEVVEEEEGEEDGDLEEELDSPIPNNKIDLPPKKLGKAKQKRLLKQKKQAATDNKSRANEIYSCQLCFEEFSSNTKLFQHINDLDHAVPLNGNGKPKRR